MCRSFSNKTHRDQQTVKVFGLIFVQSFSKIKYVYTCYRNIVVHQKRNVLPEDVGANVFVRKDTTSENSFSRRVRFSVLS